MTHFGYIVAGYGLTAAILGGYAWWIRVRSRALAAETGTGFGTGSGFADAGVVGGSTPAGSGSQSGDA